MMPVIRISNDTWERLKSHARPLEDSADDVVKRALDALDLGYPSSRKVPVVHEASPRKQAKGKKIPQKEFRFPLMKALLEEGGQASTKRIREILETRMEPHMGAADHEIVSSGDPRWWNAACWERNELVKEGLLRSDSERGTWALSDAGTELVQRGDSPRSSGDVTWCNDVEAVLKEVDLGEGASLAEIYRAVTERRRKAGRSVPTNLEAVVRRELENHSSDSDVFQGNDIFCMVKGKGAGIWGLRRKKVVQR